MRVLWTSMYEFPSLSKRIGHSIDVFGGWVNASANALLCDFSELKLGVIVPSEVQSLEKYEIDDIVFYRVPCKNHIDYSDALKKATLAVIDDFNPDIIHVNGTEHVVGLSLLDAVGNKIPVVSTIQGFAHVCKHYTDGGIRNEMKRFVTLRDLFGQSSSRVQTKLMHERGNLEEQIVRKLQFIIGRTAWDKSHALALNPTINYYHCNESLRPSFFEHEWNYQQCNQHSILVSNGTFALKGVHQVIKALPLIKQVFGDVKVNIVGDDFFCSKNFRERLRTTGYQKYLFNLAKTLGVRENIQFLGTLSEENMCKAFLDCNIYVLPSCIENSPNSLGEAQTLGVPAISSYVGGVPSLIEEGKTGLMYRYEEYEMLAQLVIQLFESKDCLELHKQERECGLIRHNPKVNAMRMYEIYSTITKQYKK